MEIASQWNSFEWLSRTRSRRHSVAIACEKLTSHKKDLAAIFSTLPLDLTFVDSDDRVAFFTEGLERIFARSKAVIGRKVQNCHPPRSVGTVDEILRDFRSGDRNTAEFWINFQSKFVHISYFAVRDQQGTYLGTLELTQDLAPLRKLEGERRLLQYD